MELMDHFYNFRRGFTRCINELLAMKLHQGPVFIYCIDNAIVVIFHSKTNFLKSVVVTKTIDAEIELILQDRHVLYRHIETTLGIYGIIIHLISHDHFSVKKICSRWIPLNFSIAEKRLVLIGRRECPKNTFAELRNTSITS